jgi:hypothetical protein
MGVCGGGGGSEQRLAECQKVRTKPESLYGRDQHLKTIEIVHRVQIKIFYFSVEIFKIETFELRF